MRQDTIYQEPEFDPADLEPARDFAAFVANGASHAAHGTSLLVVAVVLVVVVAQERGVLPAPEVLFQAAFGLGIDVASAAEEGKKYGEEY